MKLLKTSLLTLTLLASTAFAETHTVKMLNAGKDGSMVFEPAVVKAQVGDTVKFTADTAGHFVKSQLVPKGAEHFASDEDQEFSVTLNKEGVYIYNCPPHRMMNMSGVIQVGKATNLKDAKKVAKDLDGKAMQNKGRLSNYLKQVK